MFLSSEQLPITGFQRDTSPTDIPLSLLLEKGSGELNEDTILAGRRTFGVFDGSTSLTSARFARQTGGRIAAEICKAAFADEDVSLTVCARLANEEIRSKAQEAGINYAKKEELWSSSAAVIRLDDEGFDWCQIGDCQILLIYTDGSYRLLTKTPGQDMETLSSWQEKSQGSSATIMELMAGEILRVRRRMNIDYGVFNGEAKAMDFLHCGREALVGVKNILLFSDGLALPQEDPYSPDDIEAFVNLYETGGLQKIRDHVRTVQRTDLSCRKYPRFKPHDDISALAISLPENGSWTD